MLYNRRFKLTVQVGTGTALTWSSDDRGGTGLKVDFSVRKTMGGIGEQADITITGLPLETIQYLCTVMRPPKDRPLPRNYVQLEAGCGDDYGVIFEGGIFRAAPSVDSPDMSVKLQCTAGFQDDSTGPFQYAGKDVPFADVAKALAANLKVPLKMASKAAAAERIKSVTLDCTGLQAMRALREYFPGVINIFMTGGVLHVTDGSAASSGSVIKLSGESGLIGTPEPTIPGMNCRSLLRPSLEAGGFVMVESVKLPDVSGVYRIVNLTHSGSNRGDEFYSNIQGVRF